jgi:hypothetical protein
MTIKQKILQWMAAIIFIVGVGGATTAIAAPQSVMADTPPQPCSEMLLTFPAWYKGLLVDAAHGNCDVINPNDVTGGLSVFIWKIVLNVIQMALNLVGYLAVGFIIFGGYKYILSTGSADGMVKARKTIFNAVIGLVLSIFSIAIVNVVAGAI